MKVKTSHIILVFCLAGMRVASGEGLEWRGFIMNQNAFRLTAPNDALMMRTRLRLNAETNGDNVHGFAAVDLLNDAAQRSETRVKLKSAYIDLFSKYLDLRVGKQQVVWGKTDGYFINDIVNPLDMSYFLLQDFDDIRMATNMLKARFHTGNQALELLFIPEFRPMQIGFTGDWAFQRPDSVNVTLPFIGDMNIPLNYADEVQSQYSLRKAEWGLRFSTFLLGTDLSLIYLKVRDDKPVYSIIQQELEVICTPTHPWLQFYGASFSRPVGTFVFRGEGGYFPFRTFNTENQNYVANGMLVKKPYLQGMLGCDYQLTATIDLSVQAIREQIIDYEAGIREDEQNTLATFMLKGRFFNETLQPMFFSIYNTNDQSYLVRLLADWNYSDNVTVSVGTDLLGGDSDTIFGQFDGNDNFFLKLQYSF